MKKRVKLWKRISPRFKNTKPFSPQLYSPREKVQNYIWIFKIGDPDDKPSVPHGHAKDVGYRLDVWTGNIYPAGKERKNSIGKLKKKELRKLYADQGVIDFAKKQIEWYRETYPHINFYVPEWFVLKSEQPKLIVKSKEKQSSTFIFIGKAFINQYSSHIVRYTNTKPGQ